MPPPQQKDFVQNYAAKRQAAIEHAKQLREMRAAKQAEPTPPQDHYAPPPQSPPQDTAPPPGAPISLRGLTSSQGPSLRSSQSYERQQIHQAYGAGQPATENTAPRGATTTFHGSIRTSTVGPQEIQVSEVDMHNAVSRGIITADQARQLWHILSTASTASTAPQQPLLSRGTNDVPSSYTQTALKAKQQQQQQQQQQPVSGKPSWNDAVEYDESEAYPEQHRYDEQPASAAAQRKSKNAKPDWNFDTAEPEDPYKAKPEPEYTTARKAPPKASAPRDNRPAWNDGFTEDTMPSDVPSPPSRPPAKKAPAKKVATKQPTAVRRTDSRQQQQAPPPPPPPASLPEDHQSEVEAFLRQKEEAAARLEQELQEANTSEPMGQCGLCGRTFRQSIVGRHEAACAKAGKKRRQFDAANQRMDIEGMSEVRGMGGMGGGMGRKPPSVSQPSSKAMPANKIPKWKQQHLQLQAAMNAVKGPKQGGGGGGMGGGYGAPPVPEPADDRVPCPHCSRKYAPDVAERHIPKCKNIISKPKALAQRR